MPTTNLPTSCAQPRNSPKAQMRLSLPVGVYPYSAVASYLYRIVHSRSIIRKEDYYAYNPFHKNGVPCCDHVCHTGGLFSANQRGYRGTDCSPRIASLRTANMPRGGLYLDARLLGLWRR